MKNLSVKMLGILVVTCALMCGVASADDQVANQNASLQAASDQVAADQNAADQATACQATTDSFSALPALALTPEPTPMTCTATAYCSSGTVSCTGCPSDSRDASCPSQRGWVKCGSTTTYCPACPPTPCNPPCKIVCGPTGGVCLSNGTCACY